MLGSLHEGGLWGIISMIPDTGGMTATFVCEGSNVCTKLTTIFWADGVVCDTC
jgi:hypothetical protein